MVAKTSLALVFALCATSAAAQAPSKQDCEDAAAVLPKPEQIQKLSQGERNALIRRLKASQAVLKRCVIEESRIALAKMAEANRPPSGWTLDVTEDRVADKRYTFAKLLPKTSDEPMRLVLGCINGALKARIELANVRFFQHPFIRYRFDDGKESLHRATAGSSPGSVYLDAAGAILKSRRLRIEIIPTGTKALFGDFDLTGAEKASQSAKCPA